MSTEPERGLTPSPVAPGAGSPWRGSQPSIALALITIVLLGMHYEVQYTLTAGVLAGAALTPLWIRSLFRYRGSVLLCGALGLALLSGLWLSALISETHEVSTQYLISNALMLPSLLVAVGVVAWARELMPLWAIGVAYAAGAGIDVVLSGFDPSGWWKFGLATPVVLGVLAVSSAWRRQGLTVIIVLALALFSALNDARSLFAELAITALLVAWQLIPDGRTARRSALRTLLAIGIIGLAAYNTTVGLLVEGFLGNEAQERTLRQIDESGSVLLGGRPEMAATFALFESHPIGFGLGAQPNLADIQIAKTGMAAINYQPNNGYVENYMFGSTFELHSNAGDLWASYGIPGLFVVLVIAALIISWIAVSISARRADALTIFLSLMTLWNLLFSPLYSSLFPLALTLGLVLLRRDPDPDPGVT